MYTLFVNCGGFTKGWKGMIFKDNKVAFAKSFYIYPATVETITKIAQTEKISVVMLYGSRTLTETLRDKMLILAPNIKVILEE